MVFHPPSWVPPLPFEPPDSVPIFDFMRDEKYGRQPVVKSRNPFTCGLTGRSYTVEEFFERSELLGRAFAKHLGWEPNVGSPWEKVVAIFSLNTIDFITAVYGVQRLNGIVTPANAVYSATELEHQLISSGATALITCLPLLDVALQAARGANISESRVFILDLATDQTNTNSKRPTSQFKSIEQLIQEARGLSSLGPLRWTKSQGSRQPAFLCFSSGTSGLPKAVKISHQNVIANVIQQATYESLGRAERQVETQTISGFLPFSHIYGLVVAAHTSTWRGDEVVVLPKFELSAFLNAIQRFQIQQLLVVPPVIIQMLRSKDICRKFDLSSVRFVYSGAAPLAEEVVQEIQSLYPTWTIAQAYGMTETCVVVFSPSEHDVFLKASGSLLPGMKVKLIDPDGNEITDYEKPGEVLVQSPSVVLGYQNNEKANAETFVYHDDGRWIRTGDEGLITVAPSGNEQIVIVDRIKELIKVKGHQVAPAELEAHILGHPAVADCAVIQIPDDRSGEVPKAFVVRSTSQSSASDGEVAKAILAHVAQHKAPYKHIKGGVEFLDEIPKSPSGKILRRVLRDKEKKARNASKAKL